LVNGQCEIERVKWWIPLTTSLMARFHPFELVAQHPTLSQSE
jgi:hypothetical protein